MKIGEIQKAIRYAQIGVSTFVLKKVNPQWSKRYLMGTLAQMPGLPSKMAQFLDMKQGGGEKLQILPVQYVKELILERSPVLSDCIEIISLEGLSASVGQVHRAQLKTGQSVAIKIQYPNIKEDVSEQLTILMKGFENIPQAKKFGLNVEEYRDFLNRFFNEELDYLKEAISQELFFNSWKDVNNIVIPHVLKEYTSDTLMVQMFEESESLKTAYQWDFVSKLECAKLLTRFVLKGFFEKGLIHTDLHPKNWGYRKNERQLVVYDFGATLTLPLEFMSAVKTFMLKKDKTSQDCLNVFNQLGFDPVKMVLIIDKLPKLVDLLFEPFNIGQMAFQPKNWQLQSRIDTLLGEYKWIFRVAGPPWFMMWMRCVNGWLHALQVLDVPVNLNDPHIGLTYLPSIDKKKESVECSDHQIPNRKLKVRVTENGSEIVSVTLPVHAVTNLEDLIPDHVLIEMNHRELRLESIKNKVIREDYAPQELFNATSGKRHYLVWIE